MIRELILVSNFGVYKAHAGLPNWEGERSCQDPFNHRDSAGSVIYVAIEMRSGNHKQVWKAQSSSLFVKNCEYFIDCYEVTFGSRTNLLLHLAKLSR